MREQDDEVASKAAASFHRSLALCAAALLGGFALNGVLSDVLPPAAEGAAFYPAIFLAAWTGGLAAGVTAALIAAILLHVQFGPPASDAAKALLWTHELQFYFFAAASIAAARLPRALLRARGEDGPIAAAELLGHLVEQAPAAIAMFDRDMRYLASSARWRACYNLGGDIVGKSHYDIFPEISEEWREVHRRALAGENARSEQDLFVRRSGKEQWLRWEVSPWRHGDRIGGIVIVSEDITRQARLQRELFENERRLKAIFESAMDAIVTTDRQGVIRSANSAASEVFGRAPDELIGRNIDVLIPELIGQKHGAFMSACAATGIGKIAGERRVVSGRRKNGADFPLELAVCEAVLNGETIFVGVMRDLGPIEEERRRFNLLRDELAHVSRLSDMGGMVAGLAHEVSQPVTAILNFSAAYRRAVAKSGKPSEADTIEKIEQQARRAAEILARLRGFIEKRPPKRREVAPEALIDDALKLVSLRSRPRIVRPRPPPEVAAAQVFVDPIQIEQVLVNMLRNADDALLDADSPEIVVEVSSAAAGRIWVGVADNGAGVDAESVEKLFSLFFTTKYDGMGVGLSICRDIVRDHGGVISYRPNAPRGSIFEFELPPCPSAHVAA